MKYFIISFLLLAGLKSFTQTILNINPYGEAIVKTRLPYGSTVKFRITNVNPFKIEGANSVIKESASFEVPAAFSQLLAPEKVSGEFDSSGNSENNWIMETDIEPVKLISLKNVFIENYNVFVSTLYKIALYNSIQGYIDSLLRGTYIIDTTTFKSNLKSYMTSLNEGDPDINTLREKGIKAFGDIDHSYIKAKGAYDDLAKKIKNEKVNFKGVLNNADKSVTLNIDSLNLTLIREKIFEKEIQFLTVMYDSLKFTNKRIALLNSINSGVDYYYTVRNTRFEVFTEAQQLTEDKVTITPKLKNAKGEILKEYSPVEIKTFGGWKVDFSTGYLLSFGGDENFTNLYDSTGVIGVQKNNTDDVKHAVGAFINAYRRTGRDVNVGLSFGFSLPADGATVGFYGGISALILEKNRLVLSFGFAENKVKELNTGNLVRDNSSETVSGKETYKFSNKNYREINYDKVYRASLFIGVTYNIFTIKK